MKNVKAIALDLDGTFLRPDGSVHPQDIEAARILHDAGFHIWIASGRHINFIAPIVRKIGTEIISAVVSSSGAAVYGDIRKPPLYLAPIVREQAADFVQLMRQTKSNGTIFEQNVPFFRFRPDANAPEEPILFYSGQRLYSYGEDYLYLDDYKPGLGGQMIKFAVIRQPKHIMEEFQSHFPGMSFCVYHLPNGLCSCEVTAAGICKSRGVQQLTEWFGISMSEVLALGDSNNDLDLLQAVGHGAVPANAQILEDGTARKISGEQALLDNKVIRITNGNDDAPLSGVLPYLL